MMNKKFKIKTRYFIVLLLVLLILMKTIYSVQFSLFAHASIGNVINRTANGNVMEFECNDNRKVKVELCSEKTVRIRLSDADGNYKPYDPQYYMVQTDAALLPAVTHTTTVEDDLIKIKTSQMEIRIYNYPLRIAMYDLDGKFLSGDTDEGMYWKGNTVGVKKVESVDGAGGIFGFGSGDHGRRANLNRYEQDFNEFSMSHGRLIAPFFMSSVGYGIFLNTIEKNTIFYKHGGGFQTEGYLDYFFMYGPDFKSILNEYAEITGRMEMYGKWAYGFMLSKYGNDNATQAEFLEWIKRLRSEGYPTDCYVFDYGWRGDIADSGNYSAGMKFGKQMWSNDTTKFPDVSAMFEEARSLGFHVGLHNNAGTPEAKGGTKLYDDETAKDWVKSYMDVVEAGHGDWFWPDEFDVLGSNTAPTFAAKGAYDAWINSSGVNTRPMFVTRGSYAGQHYATAWSGDINNTSEELAYQIGFSLDAGLVGYWASSNDLGGFMKKPSNELYTRWVSEFGAWNSIMRTHGHDGREPWLYDETAQETLKKNLKIRYALYPYIYTTAWQGYSRGVPMMRAMILEDDSQNNSKAWDLNKQYYFGDWFLVAPATDTSDTVVSVWLPPKTTWYNYYTGEMYSGGENGKTIRVAAALEEIPVFVKAGAIVPMGPDVNYADEKPLNPLTLDIYPYGTTTYTLFEDDGESRDYITNNAYTTTKYICVQDGKNVSLNIGARLNHNQNSNDYIPENRSYNLKFNNIGNVYGVSFDGTSLDRTNSIKDYNNVLQGYYYDETAHILYVRISDDGEEMNISINSDGLIDAVHGNENQGLPPQSVTDGYTYEAENAQLTSASGEDISVSSKWKGYTGSGYVSLSDGDKAEMDLNVVLGGTYDFVLRVRCAKKSLNDSKVRTGRLYLDDENAYDLSFIPTNVSDSSGNGIWTEYKIKGVNLSDGRHKITFIAEGTNGGGYDLDSITFNRYDTSVDAFSEIKGDTAAYLWGDIGTVKDEGLSVLKATKSGAWAQFREVKGENKSGINLRIKSSTGGTVVVYENGVGDKVLASFEINSDNNWHIYQIDCKNTDAIESDIYFEFKNSIDLLDISLDWFKFTKKINAYASTDAIKADERYNINVGTNCLINIYDGSRAKFANIDFGADGASSVSIYAASGNTSDGGTAEVYIDDISSKNLIAKINVGKTGSWSDKQTFTAYCNIVNGMHDVYFVFKTTSGKAVCDFYSFRFGEIAQIGENTTIELENGTGVTNDAGNALRVDKEWSGYTGDGYVAGWKKTGNYVEVIASVEKYGLYGIKLRGAAGMKNNASYDSTPRSGAVYIDGVKIADFGLTVQSSWATWIEYDFGAVRISNGVHTFKIVAEGENAGNFNLDNLLFTRITDENNLRDLVAGLNDLDGANYEQNSWNSLQNELTWAKTLLTSLTSTQNDIDEAFTKLTLTKNALTKAGDSSDSDSDTSGTTDTGKPDKPNKGGKGCKNTVGANSIALAGLSIAAAAIIKKKRKK